MRDDRNRQLPVGPGEGARPPAVLYCVEDIEAWAGLRDSLDRELGSASRVCDLRTCADCPAVNRAYDSRICDGSIEPNPAGPPYIVVTRQASKSPLAASASLLEGAQAVFPDPVDPRAMALALRAISNSGGLSRNLQERVAQLSGALEQDQVTSFAVGILMSELNLPRPVAWECLRAYCRANRIRVADLSAELVALCSRQNELLLAISAQRR